MSRWAVACVLVIGVLVTPAAGWARPAGAPRSQVQLREIIRAAERNQTIADLPGVTLFPHLPASRACTIPAGGIVAGGHVAGRCTVSVAGSRATPVVAFVEQWSGSGGHERHTWKVVLRNTVPTLVSESGAAPPQSWG